MRKVRVSSMTRVTRERSKSAGRAGDHASGGLIM